MTHQISLEEASTNLTALLKEAMTGVEVVITQSGQPVAKLVPLANGSAIVQITRRAGTAKNSILHMAADFDAPLEDFKDYM